MSSSEGRMSSLREKAVAGIDSAYPHETRDQWKSRIFNHILAATAEWVEGMPKRDNPFHYNPRYTGRYATWKRATESERAAIVTELRKEG